MKRIITLLSLILSIAAYSQDTIVRNVLRGNYAIIKNNYGSIDSLKFILKNDGIYKGAYFYTNNLPIYFPETVNVNTINIDTVSADIVRVTDSIIVPSIEVLNSPGIGLYINGSSSEGIEIKNTVDAAINILNPDGYGYGIYIANGRVQIDDTTNINATLTATKVKTITDLPYSKVLLNNTSTTIMTVVAPSDSSTNGNSIGGSIPYSVSIKGSNGYQIESGIIVFSALNYSGILTMNITSSVSSKSVSSGTLSSSYDITYSTGVYSIKVLFNSNLTSPVLNFEYDTNIKGGTKTAQ